MIGIRLWLVFLAICLASSSLTAYGLRITLDSAKTEYSLTEGIELSLSFYNDGNRSIFLARPKSYGTGSNTLRIIAERKGCEYEVPPIHFDSPTGDLKFLFVPLLQEDTLTHPLPVVADAVNVGGLDLFLPGPGAYSFSLEFKSEGESYEAFVGPLWRGTAKSNVIELYLLPPSPSEIKYWRRGLRNCVQSGSCMANPAVLYFRYVQDEDAARLLVEALQAEPNDTFAAEALFRQAIPQAAEVLRATSTTPSVDPEIRKHYLSLAERLESASTHDCPEVLSVEW
jgi:hypothetical protein